MKWPVSAFADEAGGTIEQQITALQNAGLDRIDLRHVNGHNITALPLDEAKAVREKLDAAGITVAMYGSPIGKIDIADDVQIDLDRLAHLAALKPVLGCNAVRMFSYYNRKENLPHDQWQASVLDNMKQLVALAQQHGMVLYHENERHIFGDLVKDVVVLRDECRDAAPDTFKMIFDFDNYNQSGEDVWEAWQVLGDTSDAIHLKESKKQPDGKYFHVPVGTGDGHVQRILQTLADRGWTGPLTLEPHLSHSDAVMATGPSGESNQALKDMTQAQTFQVAADAAIAILTDVGRWD